MVIASEREAVGVEFRDRERQVFGVAITGAVMEAVVGVVFGYLANRAGREGWSFIGLGAFLAAGAGAIFVAAYPVVIPSTINHAFDLTVTNASSSPYTLGVMTIVACFGLPLVLGYQAWTYWVFRKRVSATQIPDVHPVSPAVRA